MTVHHECSAHSKLVKRVGEKLGELRIVDADHCCGGVRRVDERTQEVKDRRRPQRPAHGCNPRKDRVQLLREEEPDSDLGDSALHRFRRAIQVEPARAKHICRSGFPADGAIAVLGDPRPCARSNEGCRGGDVEARATIATGSDHIDRWRKPGINRHRMTQQEACRSRQLAMRHTLHAQRHEESREGHILDLALQDFPQHCPHRLLVEVFPGEHGIERFLKEHDGTSA